MIRRLACAPAVLSIMLIGCGVGDAQQDLSGDTPIPAETAKDLTEAAAGQSVLIDEPTSAGSSSGAQAASPQSAGDAGTDDGSNDGGNRADGGKNGPMTADVLEELERTLDEIDRLLADLELDLEAD